MWRCANDAFGYCNGKPEWEIPPDIREDTKGRVIGTLGGTCKNDKYNCGKFKSFLDAYGEQHDQERRRHHAIS